MDARVGDRVITPRIGKPVEIQALWLNALWIASQVDSTWREPFERGRVAFLDRFWNEDLGRLADVVDVDHVAPAHGTTRSVRIRFSPSAGCRSHCQMARAPGASSARWSSAW